MSQPGALMASPDVDAPAKAPLSPRRIEAAVWAGFVAVVAFLLRGALAGGVLFRRDIHLVWHPQVEAFVRAVAAGSWPVWDPGPVFGQPLLADPSAMMLYPLTWLNLLVRPWTYYTLFVAAHLLFSAAGMRLLGRRLGLSGPASFTAALLWTASGPFLSLIDLWHHFASAAWMPWVLLAADAALASPRLSRALLWGAAMGAQILAGSADMVSMTGLIALGLLLSRSDRTRLTAPANRRLVVRAAVAGLFALALSAGLWMTALDVAVVSDRASLPSEVRTFWSVHPLTLPQTVLAGLWAALPLRSDLRAAFYESREPFLASLYLGLPALALVGAALAGPRRRARTVLVVAFATAILVALGKHGPFYDVLVVLLPPLRILRYPTKAMVPAALAWSLLAGMGYDAWARASGLPRRRWMVSVAVPLALVLVAALAGAVVFGAFPGVAGPRLLEPGVDAARTLRPAALTLVMTAVLAALALGFAVRRARSASGAATAAAVLAGLAVVDLLAAHRSLQPFAPRELYTHRPEVVRSLDGQPHGRVYAYDYTRGEAMARLARKPGVPLERVPEGWSLEAALALAMQMHLAPATAGRWNLHTAYDLDYRGLYPHELGQLTLVLRAVEGTPVHTHLLRLAGVTHVVSLHAIPGLRPLAQFTGLYPEPTRLLAVPDPLPRTYAVAAARVADGVDAFRMVLDGELRPAREVLLPGGAPLAAPAGFRGSSRVLAEAPDRVTLEATLSAPGFVVLLDGYARGWRARVDGRPVAVSRANLAFRAVAVPAGTHVIEYVYRPLWMLFGLAVSAAAALLGAGAGLMVVRRSSSHSRRVPA